MRAAVVLVLAMGCVPGKRVPHRYAGPIDLGAIEHCIQGETRGGARVAFCASKADVCERVARWGRQHGDSWLISDEDLKLAWLDHCGNNGIRPRMKKTPALKVTSQRAVFP